MIDDLKPYPEYRDSNQPWLGRIPTHWKLERAKNLFQKMSRPISPGDDVVTCFRDGVVTLRKNRRLSGFTESLKEIGYQGVRQGDLVIHAMDAFAGAIGVSDSDGKSTPVYSVCQPKRGANSHYYAHIVREMARSQWVMALAKGIRERSTDFRFEGFASQFVPFPSEDEQALMAAFLKFANQKIENYIRAKKKLIALLNEQKQTIVQRAVTRGLNPNVRLKSSDITWLGDIPEHWEVSRIKYLLRDVDDRSTIGSETLLSMRMHHGLVPFAEHFSRPPQSKTLVGFKIVHPGQVVVNRMQAGNGLIFASQLTGLVSPDYAVFAPIGDVNVEFLGELFRCRKVRAKFRAESKGLGTGTSGFLRLYNDRFGAIHIALPPPTEQSSILENLAEQLQDLNRPIAATQREIALIGEYRARLISDVVTGKMDVREAASKLPKEDEITVSNLGIEEDIEDIEGADALLGEVDE